MTNKIDRLHEIKMIQSRLLSPIIKIIEDKKYSYKDLEYLTGLATETIERILNCDVSLTMEHIILFQNGLEIVLQPPKVLSLKKHIKKYYG